MSAHQRVTNEQVVEAYQQTGSVWKAAKLLGIGGQSTHERLQRMGYKTIGAKWSEDEITELRALVAECTIADIASRLGRPYAGVAAKISDLGIGSRFGNRVKVKIPRGAGFDKVSVSKYISEIDGTGFPITRYAKAKGLSLELLVLAIEKYDPDWWANYRREHSDLPEATCPYCGAVFIPANKRQVYCTRRCANLMRTDESYFGGKRRNTIGLAENICQLCGRNPGKGVSSHHVLGKENDPENDVLVALCSGCHQIVTIVGGREWTTEQWEALISLAWLRKNGPTVAGLGDQHALHVTVEVEFYEDDES